MTFLRSIQQHFNQSPPKSRQWSIGLTTLERVHRKNKQLLVWITVYIPVGSGWWTCTQPNTVLSVSLDWPDMFNLAPVSSAMQDRLYLKRKTRFSVHSPYSLELELRQICFLCQTRYILVYYCSLPSLYWEYLQKTVCQLLALNMLYPFMKKKTKTNIVKMQARSDKLDNNGQMQVSLSHQHLRLNL